MSLVPDSISTEAITIDAALDLQAALTLREALLSRLDGTFPIKVDLSAAMATAPALQLAAALRASLAARGRFAGFGPTAAQAFGQTAEPAA